MRRQRKFRGRRRYFRTLLDRSAQIDIGLDEGSWFDQWHDHPDWYGYGALSWKSRLAHLHALATAYRACAKQLEGLGEPYQVWMLVASDEPSNDAVFVHTANPNGTPFPWTFPGGVEWTGDFDVEWGVPLLSSHFEKLLPGLSMRAARLTFAGTTDYVVYSPAVGLPLEPTAADS